MKVNSYAGTATLPHRTTPRTQVSTNFSTLMTKVAAKSSTGENVGVATTHISPTWLDYRDWQETREPIEVPSENGWTAENIQYLKDRYPGELSMFERVEALQSMLKMKCITPEEYQKAIGSDANMVVEDATVATCVSGPLEGRGCQLPPHLRTVEVDWYKVWSTLPINEANSLEKLFDLLEENSNAGRYGT